MSGGVDSSVTAALLVEQGYDVHGVSLRMWEGERGPQGVFGSSRRQGSCRTSGDSAHAARFARSVRRDSCEAFRSGLSRTGARPILASPVTATSSSARLLRWAKEQGADYVATGHYARVVHDDRARPHVIAARRRRRQGSVVFFVCSVAGAAGAHGFSPRRHAEKRGAREGARLEFARGRAAGEPGYLLRRLQGVGGDLCERKRA